MATKLKNMKLTSVDLVRAGANQEADICLFKSADPPEASERPTKAEETIFKRFLNWLRDEPEEPQNEPQVALQKKDLESIYKSALADSLTSIMKDDSLTEAEKKAMTDESLDQFRAKLKELEEMDELEDRLEDEHDSPEAEIKEEMYEDEWDDDDRYDEIEEVKKYNHNHGADGKFTTSGGGGGAAPAAGGGGGLNDKAKEIMSAGGFDKAYKVADLVGEMKVGDTVTCKDYRKGDIMEFKKVSNADTISAFQNVRGKNHMASPQQVKSWVRDSITYAKYDPSFKEGSN